MKVSIGKTEWYPVYVIYQTEPNPSIEISDDLFARYVRNMDEFDAIQQELMDLRGSNRG